MSDYTDEDVLRAAKAEASWLMGRPTDTFGSDELDRARAVLDAVVPGIVARAKAEAWDEGYTAGHSNAMRRMSDEPNAPTSPNPYRATGPTTDREA